MRDGAGERDFGRIFRHPYLEVILPHFEGSLRDVDGRPLGEANAPAPARLGTVFDYRRCPYAGSRRDGLMNASALRPLVTHWSEILALFEDLRTAFMARYPVPMNNLLLARMAVFVTYYPGWLVRTGRLSWNRIPRSVSGLYKAAQGLYFTCNDAMIAGGADAAFAKATVEGFIDRTETRGLFRMGNHVCAGPPKMVRDFASIAIDGGADGAGGSTWLAPADQLTAALAYAELRFRAAQADRDDALALSAALDRADGLLPPDDHGEPPTVLAATAALPPVVEETLPDLLRTEDAASAAVALPCARSYARLALDFAAAASVLQARIDKALGRAAGSPFNHEERIDLLAAAGHGDLHARADGYFDVLRLARLINEATAGGRATCHRP